MKFEKKVIIGSITSFIITAVGIVAVFFPSLLNLEKKKANEMRVFLKDQKSADTLNNFLKNNTDKLVKLTITYCAPKSREIYNIKPGEEAKKYVTAEEYVISDGVFVDERLYFDGKYENALYFSYGFEKLYYIGERHPMIDSGYIAIDWRNDIKIGASNSGKIYKWDTEYYTEDDKKFKEEMKICKVPKLDEFDLGYSFGYIDGVFYVRWSEENEYGGYVLEPLDKKEFELRNY